MDKEEQRGLETLVAWQKAVAFTIRVHREVLPKLPPEEKYALAIQLRRAVQSVPANIAEGYGRYTFKDSSHFYYIARGSLEEVYTYLVLAHRLNYLDDALFHSLQDELRTLRHVLNGYLKFLRKQRRS
ncbi:MAG TPA: four helix bundle protein [Chloroflexi bacterium]|nr:four helix bundle protein [Chloroflexota bacterium]